MPSSSGSIQGRFSAFAALPLPHLDAALKELTRGLDELGMLGATVTTDVLGVALADASLVPLWRELDRRGTVRYVHPSGAAAGTPLIAGHHMRWMVGALVEDKIGCSQLLLAGTPGRYPNVKIIIFHLGGALPMLLQRIDKQYAWESPDTPEKPSVAARRLWYDTVGNGQAPAVRAAAETLGADRLVLGTDFRTATCSAARSAISRTASVMTPPGCSTATPLPSSHCDHHCSALGCGRVAILPMGALADGRVARSHSRTTARGAPASSSSSIAAGNWGARQRSLGGGSRSLGWLAGLASAASCLGDRGGGVPLYVDVYSFGGAVGVGGDGRCLAGRQTHGVCDARYRRRTGGSLEWAGTP